MRKKENPLFNVAFNVVFPAIILTQLSEPERLGPLYALLIALSLPIGYGLYDIVTRKKVNIFSIFGLVGVLITGGIALLELDYRYIAIKEAAIPFSLAIAIILTQRTRFSLLRLLIVEFIDLKRVDDAFASRGYSELFERQLKQVSLLVGVAFLVSALLNYGLAVYIVVSPTGTAEFNRQLGVLQALSYPVIVVPTMAIIGWAFYRLSKSIRSHTDLTFEDIFKG